MSPYGYGYGGVRGPVLPSLVQSFVRFIGVTGVEVNGYAEPVSSGELLPGTNWGADDGPAISSIVGWSMVSDGSS